MARKVSPLLVGAGILGAGLLLSSMSGAGGPRGKGIFVRSTYHVSGPAELIAFCDDLGLSWVILPVVWQYTNKSNIRYDQQLEDFSSALRKAGIEVWVWGWPEPTKRDEFAELMIDARRRASARGIVVNAEETFYGEPQAALELARSLRGQTWALSSYGAPWFHGPFPFSEFATTTNLGMPQIYDTQHTLGDDYPSKSVAAWRDLGFSSVTPTWGASTYHTADQMRDIASRTLAVGGIQGASWWDLYHLLQSSSRRGAVRDIQVPAALA